MVISLWYCDRQTDSEETVERQTDSEDRDRTESETMSCLITHKTHRRYSWTYLSSRRQKERKPLQTKPSINLRKLIYFCFFFISSLHSYFFISFPYGKKNNHITGMYCLKYWVLFWFFCRKYDNFSQILEKRTEKVIFLDHNFFKNIS